MSADFTTITGVTSLGTMTAGTPKEYSVVARDSFGNIVENNDFVISVSVSLIKSSSTAPMNSSSTVTMSFKNFESVQVRITLSGSYSISVIANLTGTHLSGSPIACSVLPGLLSVLDSKFRTVPVGGPVNQPTEFYISTFDAYGNKRLDSPEVPSVTILPPISSANFSVAPFGSVLPGGLYVFAMTSAIEMNVSVLFNLNDAPVTVAPIYLQFN